MWILRTNYCIPKWWPMGPFRKVCPPWLKPLVTPLETAKHVLKISVKAMARLPPPCLRAWLEARQNSATPVLERLSAENSFCVDMSSTKYERKESLIYARAPCTLSGVSRLVCGRPSPSTLRLGPRGYCRKDAALVTDQ